MKSVETILSDLISFRTDSQYTSNKEIIDYIVSYFKDEGLPFQVLTDESGVISSLIAGVNVKSLSNIQEGIILSGHLDTVPASFIDWDTLPFYATQKDNRIYGRGAVDMKHSIAIFLSLLPEFKKINMPILFAFSGDEETSCQGIRQITAFCDQNNIKPLYALVAEPTGFQIGVQTKGCHSFRTQIKGVSCHSSVPYEGINSISIAARLICFIEQLCQLYQGRDLTLNVGKIVGGEESNIVPSDTYFDWEIRYLNNDIKQEVYDQILSYQKALSREYKNALISVVEKDHLPSFKETSTNLVDIAQSYLIAETVNLSYATEAGYFKSMGCETIILGAGDEDLAHKANEFIEISELHAYRDFIMKFLQKLSLSKGL